MIHKEYPYDEDQAVPKTFPTQTDSTTGYSGRILAGDYSKKLKETVEEEIAACRAYDQIGLRIMPYIAAWRVDQPGIWYEFVSRQFLELFDISPDRLSQVFSNAIIDRRKYEQAELYPDIEEMILPRQKLNHQRQRIREESIQTGETEAVYKVQLPDNRTRWLKDWAMVKTFLHDGICLSPGCLADVSMEMQQKDQVDELNVMVNRDKGLLVEAERHAALGQLSAQVFHEIRNPILSIGGLAKRLSEHFPADGGLQYMAVIVNEAKRLENILNNLFSITSPVVPDPKPTDPVQMVKSVVGLLRSDLDRNNIKLSFRTHKHLPNLFIDRELIHESLVHIIKNSIEAMPDGGTLSIQLDETENSVLIKILDSGPGIAAAHEKRATEPFFTTKVYGAGLGLSLAKKSTELHGGELIIRQLDSGGTEVCMFLPLKKSDSK